MIFNKKVKNNVENSRIKIILYISKKLEEGIRLSYMDIIYATVVRIIAERPSLNRFAMNR